MSAEEFLKIKQQFNDKDVNEDIIKNNNLIIMN